MNVTKTMEKCWRFRFLKLAHNCFRQQGLRMLSSGNYLLSPPDFKIREHFPNAERLNTKYLSLSLAEKLNKNFICNELIEECDIDTSAFYLHGFERMYILTMDFSKLKKHKLIKPSSNQETVVNKMLSYLEPFPFNSKVIEDSEQVTMKLLRDSIEKQYLAWRYKVDLQQISDIMARFSPTFFIGRSLRNLKRNCFLLDIAPSFKHTNLSKKIYLINQQPFNIKLMTDFENCFGHLKWDSFSSAWASRAFCHSFSHICFLIRILRSKGFRTFQIQEGLIYLSMNLRTFINRMNVILSHPALLRYIDHSQFLHLLHYPSINLMNLEIRSFENFEELRDELDMIYGNIKSRKGVRPISIATIKYHTADYFPLGEEHVEMITRHPKYSMINENQLGATLRFLKKKHFTAEEILESIIIILYPSAIIQKGLQKIAEEETALREKGFVDGCVPEETDYFNAGTKSKRKTLQLCLYYIEKQFNFSWDGVLSLNTEKSDEEEL